MNATNSATHKWRFFRTGGLDQVMLRNGSDIANLAALDQKLWVALSCPTQGLRFDARTLDLLDTDRDGRIRVPELLAAIDWLAARLTSLDPLLDRSGVLPLSVINAATPEGAGLLASARRILANLGKADATSITLADAADTAKIFAETRFNGDGVIPADAAEDEDTRQAVADIIATCGAVTDRSGKPGVDQARADAFFAAADAFLAWTKRPAAEPEILPLGAATAAAAAATDAVRVKLDDYFTRCRMAAFDARAAGPLSRADSDFAAFAGQDLTDSLPALAGFPLSRIEAGRDLPLRDGVNPYWSGAVAAFAKEAVAPLLGAGRTALSAADWQTLKDKLAPFNAWRAVQAGALAAPLGADRLAALAAGPARAKITALIAQDAALAAENDRIAEVEKLLRYHAHLATLLNNFVNMARLYDPKACAIFRVGTLYMDARACNLCFHVTDIGAHSAQAAASKCCLAYCSLSRPGEKETRTICAAFTAGFAQTLWVGRNGLFYDLDGKDWDATIVKLVDHSISLKEAFWDPWRKIAGMVGGQVKKMLAAKQDAALTGAAKKIETTGAAPAEAPKKMEGAALASSVAALGIAVGLIGSAVGGLVGMVAGLPLWKTALGLVAVVLLVSGPAMILTWFKLRARDVAPILNACGWAVNRSLRLSLKLGRLFTAEAVLPASAERELTDPFADSHATRNTVLALLAAGAVLAGLWFAGLLDGALPDSLKKNRPTPAVCVEPPTNPALP